MLLAIAIRLKAIAIRLEAIAIRLEAIATRLGAIAIRLEASAIRLEAIATRLGAIAIRLEAIAIWLEAILSRLEETIPIRLEASAIRLENFSLVLLYYALGLRPFLRTCRRSTSMFGPAGGAGALRCAAAHRRRFRARRVLGRGIWGVVKAPAYSGRNELAKLNFLINRFRRLTRATKWVGSVRMDDF